MKNIENKSPLWVSLTIDFTESRFEWLGDNEVLPNGQSIHTQRRTLMKNNENKKPLLGELNDWFHWRAVSNGREIMKSHRVDDPFTQRRYRSNVIGFPFLSVFVAELSSVYR
ncbi:hypothetical protein CEXT_158521 [Caerostris extrusa]|uniref:Uncharacterized protein n=1 Tax=Caerostris extrusa TaxID=172846 RepID=A0AAV4W173_CAEEX|nr:hypothetical protein CEXT_158521 [Caerostris extrusa]